MFPVLISQSLYPPGEVSPGCQTVKPRACSEGGSCLEYNGLHFYLYFHSRCKWASETLFPLKMCGDVSLHLNPAGPRSSTSKTGLFGAGTLLHEKQALGCFTCRSPLLWSGDMELLMGCVTACCCRSHHGVNLGKGKWTNPAINI